MEDVSKELQRIIDEEIAEKERQIKLQDEELKEDEEVIKKLIMMLTGIPL